MRRSPVFMVLAALTSCAAFGQQKPVFDIADVHVSPRSSNPSLRGGVVRSGKYELRTATMVDLIRIAYGVDSNNVVGGPAWLDTDRFDVIAKLPQGASQDTARLMLQTLLAGRFRLELHNDTKPITGYVLSFVKRSAQLKETQADADPASARPGCRTGEQERTPEGIGFVSYVCRNVPMEMFAELLRGMAPGYIQGNPIVDQTGLKGNWDFNIKWVGRAQVAAAGGDGVSLFGSIDKLGLKLELKSVPQPVIVVDRVNQKPTDNAPGVAQSLPEVPEQFEVIEIRPSPPGGPEGEVNVRPGGRLDARGITLKDMIEFGWQIDGDDALFGAPEFLDTNRFDIVAKAPSVIAPDGKQMQVDFDTLAKMVQSLLADRFKLKIHNDVQPINVFALIAAKPKMKAADPSNRTSCKNSAMSIANVASSVSRTFICQNITMAQFADKLVDIASGYLNHPVVDLSGIEGAWDFSLNFSPVRAMMVGGNDPNGAVSLFEAMEKQLGLKLEQRKHPMPVIVIDHVEKAPTEN